MSKITTISISHETKARICVHGKMGQSMNEVMEYILDTADEMAKRLQELEGKRK